MAQVIKTLNTLSRRARLALTGLAAVAAFLVATVPSQPAWAVGVESGVLAVAAAFGIKPPHQE